MAAEQRAESKRWASHPHLARIVSLAVVVVPFLTAMAVAFLLSARLPIATGGPAQIVRWVGIVAASTMAMIGVDRVARRLLPLSALLKLTLVFPDQAPSRFSVAMRTGTTAQLAKRLEAAGRVPLDETPQEAAERLLELVGLLSQHDRLTRGHSERVRAYTHLIGEELGLTGAELDKLRWAGLLHDIGKTAVAAGILNKPGRLTDDEFAIIRTHPEEGRALVGSLAEWLGESIRAVWEHHEKFDGTGYPQQLSGLDISFAARVVTVADCYDVMTSARSYKRPMSVEAARTELAACSGTHFDPVVVRAFFNVSLGRLRLMTGPLAWFAQLALFEPSGVAHAGAGGSGTGTGAASATSGTAGGATAGAVGGAGAGVAVSTGSAGVISTFAATAIGVAASTVGIAAASPATPADLAPVADVAYAEEVDSSARAQPGDTLFGVDVGPDASVGDVPTGVSVGVDAVDGDVRPGSQRSAEETSSSPASTVDTTPGRSSATTAGSGAGSPSANASGRDDVPRPTSARARSADAAAVGNGDATDDTQPVDRSADPGAATSTVPVATTAPTTHTAPATTDAGSSTTATPARPTAPPTFVATTTMPDVTVTTLAPPTIPTTTATTTTTTITAPATTSTAPTTSTKAGSGPVFHLGGDVRGDSPARSNHPLTASRPPDIALPNVDTDRDAAPGASVKRSTTGIASGRADEVLVFEGEMNAPLRIDGRARIQLWVADDGFGKDKTVVRVGLYRCSAADSCELLGSDDKRVSNTPKKWKKVKFQVHGVDANIQTGERLEVRIAVLASGQDDAHIAFGTQQYDSTLDLDLDD